MLEIKDLKINTTPTWIKIGIALPVLFITFFYLSYARDAWFWQDDFGFIAQYSSSIHLKELFDFSNFGRFLSRNIYWYYGIKFFSYNSQYFYLFNFFIIAITSLLIYKLMSERYGQYAGLIAALIYFCLPATIASYAWLSNSQHLLGHLFVILFVFVYFRKIEGDSTSLNFISTLVLFLILLTGFSSNIFMGMSLTLPAWMMLTNKSIRKDKYNFLILFFGSIVFAYFIVKLGKHQTDAYSTAYTIETLKKNSEFYFRSELLAFAWLFFIIVGVIVFYRLNKLFEAWLLIASATFFLPFAFLEHQRYGQYGTLSYLFFALGCWSMLLDFLNRRKIFLVPQAGVIILIFIFLFSLEPTIRYFSENPRGRDQKKQVEQLRLFDSKNHQINNYCFKPEKFVENKTGVKVWDIPADWWFVGFGSAFSLFVNKNKTYQLYNDSLKCDVIFVFKGFYLEIVSE